MNAGGHSHGRPGIHFQSPSKDRNFRVHKPLMYNTLRPCVRLFVMSISSDFDGFFMISSGPCRIFMIETAIARITARGTKP